MIEYKDLKKVQQHLISLELQEVPPEYHGMPAYWVLPDTWNETRRCPFAIVVRQAGWDFEFWIRVCSKFFALETVESILSLDREALNQMVDTALETEFMIAKLHQKTGETIQDLLASSTNKE